MDTIGKGGFGFVLLVEERNTGVSMISKEGHESAGVAHNAGKDTTAVSFPLLVKMETYFQTRTSPCVL